MPQLDVLYFPSQILWLIISFLLLYSVFKYYIIPKIDNLLALRSSQINRDLEEASKLRDVAKDLEETLHKKQLEMHNEIASIRVNLINDLNKTKMDNLAKLHSEIADKENEAFAEIALAKKQAVDDLHKYVVENAGLLIEKLTNHKIDVESLKIFYGNEKC